MAVEDDYPPAGELTSRAPSAEDLRDLCRELNACEAKYIVIGGFAINAAGYARMTMDVDLLVDTSLENESRVYKALESLLDKAVRELQPGEIAQYTVVRVGDHEGRVFPPDSSERISFATGHDYIPLLRGGFFSVPNATSARCRATL